MQLQRPFSITISQKQQRLPLAVLSLVLGFLSCTIFGILTGIPAVIIGHISLSKIKNNPIKFSGKRLAISGLILGYTGITMTIVFVAGMILLYLN